MPYRRQAGTFTDAGCNSPGLPAISAHNIWYEQGFLTTGSSIVGLFVWSLGISSSTGATSHCAVPQFPTANDAYYRRLFR